MGSENALVEIAEGDVEELLGEAERYLAAVEVFRAEGAEPCWANDEALPEYWLEEWRVARRSDTLTGPLPVG